MKYIAYILLLFISVSAIAQTRPTGVPSVLSTNGWYKIAYVESDSGLIVRPRDTASFFPRFTGTIVMQPNNRKFYYYDSTDLRWYPLAPSTIDTTSLSNRINLKLNISDTVGQWLSQNTRLVDTIYRVNDSTVGFKIKGTAYTFQILGRLPTSGTGTVTSVALSMPSAFSVSGSPITTNGTFSVSGAGTTAQYIRGNGTLATTDTGMIPNFYLKVRSLLTGNSPITYNSTTGAIGILNANTTGTKGAASFSSDFSDNGAGLISLSALVSNGSCTGCNLNIGSDGRITGYSDGAGGATNNTNIGSGFRALNSTTQEIRTFFAGFGVRLDSVANANGLTWSSDTTRGSGLPTYYYVDSISGVTASNGLIKTGNDIQLGDATAPGASLTHNTYIDAGASYGLNVTGSLTLGSATGVLGISNTGTGNGIYATATTGSGVKGAATSGNAVFGIATTGVGGQFNTTSGTAAIQGYNSGGMAANLSSEPSSTNTTQTVLTLGRGTTGTAGNNIAGAIDFTLTTTTTPYQLANKIISKLTNATNSSYASQLEFWGASSATVTRKAALASTGQWTWDGYPALTAQTDTTTYKPVAIDGSGNVVKMVGWTGGAGASQNLQQVTNIGATTSNKMSYTTLPYFLISDSAVLPNKKYIDTRQESFLGTIYTNNSWPNLSDFTLTGGISATASGNKISISGGAGTFTQTLDYNWYSMLERWKMTIRFKINNATSSTTYGIGIGMHSTNTYGAVNALGRIDLTNSGTGGKVILNGHTDNRQMAISSNALTFSQNDTIELRVERKVDSLFVIAINRSQGNASVNTSMAYELVTGIPQLPNTGRFSIYAFGGTQLIDSLTITSQEIKDATALVIGDSKTQGYYAQTFNNRYASKYDNKIPTTVLHAGGFDRTTEWLTYLPEIKSLNPKQILLTNPSNDLRSGISSTTSHANYQQIVDSLTSWGVNVFHALAFYETSQDNSAWNTYITSTFPSNMIIDTWSPTKNCSGCVAGDGVHLTALGNDTIYNTLLWQYKIFGGDNNAQGQLFTGTNNTLAMFLDGNLVDSKVYQDANRVYMSTGFESNSTSPGFDIFKTNAGTDEKGWNFYNDATNMYIATFNDARSAVYNAMKFNRTGNSVNYIAAPQAFVVGQSTDPGTYMQSIVTTGAPMLRVRTSNTAGGYIGFENGTTPKAYMGYGSVLTTGASDDDVTLRSQDDIIHFSDNTGAEMVKINAGKLFVSKHTIASNSDSAIIWDRSTNEYKYAKINGGSATTIYNGDGTLSSNRTVTMSSNNLTFTGGNFIIANSNYFRWGKSDGSAPYTSSIGVTSRNSWQFAYSAFTRGVGLYVDTLNNVGLGDNTLTTMPLYATGNSVYINGLQSEQGNFYAVQNITAGSTTLSITANFVTLDATAGNITLTLPSASAAFGGGMGLDLIFKRLDNTGNTITVQRAGSDLIDNATSFTLATQFESKKLRATSSSGWSIY